MKPTFLESFSKIKFPSFPVYSQIKHLQHNDSELYRSDIVASGCRHQFCQRTIDDRSTSTPQQSHLPTQAVANEKSSNVCALPSRIHQNWQRLLLSVSQERKLAWRTFWMQRQEQQTGGTVEVCRQKTKEIFDEQSSRNRQQMDWWNGKLATTN